MLTIPEVKVAKCKTAVSPSRLPGLDWALNPYRGCQHACAYCYAQDVTRFEMSRPWGSVVVVKAGVVQCLKRELDRRTMEGTFGIGTVTDPYQPLERGHELTRGCLTVLKRRSRSVSVLTKSDLVLRDLDILREWPSAEVGISVGTPDDDLARVLEPGAPAPERRFKALRGLAEAGVSVYLMAAPVMVASPDSVQRLAEMAHDSGVRRIMWDKFNPKPIASSRLKRCMAEAGRSDIHPLSSEEVGIVRRSFEDACLRLGIELVEAF